MIVVDASVAVKWFREEPDSARARSLGASREHLIAPELVIAETLNALWRALRVGQLTAAQLDAVADDLPSYFDELHPLSTYGRRASHIARVLGHPVYNCFYLALAEAQNARFVTADGRLLTRAAGHPSASRMLALTALGA